MDLPDLNNVTQTFSESLVNLAQACSPPSKPSARRLVPWWNKSCLLALRNRRKALRKVQRNPTTENLIHFRRMRAIARRTFKQSRLQSWHSYVSRLSPQTPTRQIWNMIRALEKKNSFHVITGLYSDTNLLTSPLEIANLLSNHFAEASNNSAFHPEFQQIRENSVLSNLDFFSDSAEPYNSPISLHELQNAIRSTKVGAIGADNFHLQILIAMPEVTLLQVLSLFNRLWSQNHFPQCWKTAIVLPLLKAGKNPTLPDSYRPISLLSVLGKIFEKIINKRLCWQLEVCNFLSPMQCGFRPGRSTQDQLLALSTRIQESFSHHRHLLTIFFDCSKAFDRTWHFKIMQQLHSWGLRGHLPLLIQSFLSSRSFCTSINGILSSPMPLQNGVPQGAVLSPTLFCIAINSLTSIIQPPITCALFADDLAISIRCKSTETGETLLQQAVSTINRWAISNGFQFSTSKTCAVHFCRIRNCNHALAISLNNAPIPNVTSAKYLGLWFDQKLTWKPHILALIQNCNLKLNLLKKIGGTRFGAHRTTLLQLYNSLIRSKLDYGSSVYISASQSVLQKLDIIQNQALRISTGALRSSPISSLHADANQLPLPLHRQYMVVNHLLRITTTSSLPVRSTTNIPFNAPYSASNFHHITRKFLHSLKLSLPSLHHSHLAAAPPWLPCILNIDTSFHQFSRDTQPIIIRRHFQELLHNYADSTVLYTDGSISPSLAGCAVTTDEETISCFSLPTYFSILSAELYAIYLAVLHIASLESLSKHFLIITDSMTSLLSLKSQWNQRQHPIAKDIIRYLFSNPSLRITFVWVPSHKGITGNDLADKIAKQAAKNFPIPNTPIPIKDFQRIIRTSLYNCWQEDWTESGHYHLRSIKPILGNWLTNCTLSRRKQVILTRIRLGHTLLTHGHYFTRSPRPYCPFCSTVPISIKHILCDCPNTTLYRNQALKQFSTASLLLDTDMSILALFKFLQDTRLFPKI